MRTLPPSERLRIIVLGYIVRGPLGGLVWHHLQYVIGLAHLGHEVYFVEDSDDYAACYDPSTDSLGTDPSYGLEFTRRVFERVGMGRHWAYYDAHTIRWLGPSADKICEICTGADLLLNLSGVNPLRPWVAGIPARVLVDTDPVFTQIRHLTDPVARESATQHTAFLSFGENFGRADCTVPDDGFPWQPTRQPVVLDAWSVTPGPVTGRFTTVMQWDSYRVGEFNGRRFGMKSESFGPYLGLPERVESSLELAVGSPSAPREMLRSRGWTISNPLEATRDPWTYQGYIRSSKAEFSVAKHGYVATWSGWFSERSAAYLASGRPIVVQDTGFSQTLPTGLGLNSFTTLDEAIAGIEAVNGDYQRHCRAARDLAEAHFDAARVLPELIAGATTSPSVAK